MQISNNRSFICTAIACLFTYACACRHEAVRLIERSLWLDIFPFHLKFTTGRIFPHILSSESRYVFPGSSRNLARSRESSSRKLRSLGRSNPFLEKSSPRHSPLVEDYIYESPVNSFFFSRPIFLRKYRVEQSVQRVCFDSFFSLLIP